MSREGWIAIRNLPLPVSSGIRGAPALWKVLKRFFSKNRICPLCQGQGFTIERELQTEEMGVIKYAGIKSLEKLKKSKEIVFSDLIKEIFLKEFAGKKICTRCKGSRFVEREKTND